MAYNLDELLKEAGTAPATPTPASPAPVTAPAPAPSPLALADEHEKLINSLVDDESYDPIQFASGKAEDDDDYKLGAEVFRRRQDRPMTASRALDATGNFVAGIPKMAADMGRGFVEAPVNAVQAAGIGVDPTTQDKAQTTGMIAGQMVEENSKGFFKRLFGDNSKVTRFLGLDKPDETTAEALSKDPAQQDRAQARLAEEQVAYDAEKSGPARYSNLFRERVTEASRLNQLAQGKPLDDNVTAGVVRDISGLNPSEIFNNEGWTEADAAKANRMATSGDLTNTLPIEIPKFAPVAGRVAGAAVEGAGKVLSKAGAAAEKTAGSSLTKAAIGAAALANPIVAAKGAVGAGVAYAAGKGTRVLGDIFEDIGRQARTGKVGKLGTEMGEAAVKGKSAIGANLKSRVGEAAVGALTAPIAAAPLNALIANDVEEFGTLEGGAVGIGAAGGAGKYRLRPEVLTQVDSYLQQEGAKPTGNSELDAKHAAFMQSAPADVQARVNALRGMIGGLPGVSANGVKSNANVYVLDTGDFIAEARRLDPSLANVPDAQLAAQRGVFLPDSGTALVNGAHGENLRAEETGYTAGHEFGGHAAENILSLMTERGHPLDAYLNESLRQGLLDERGNPTPEYLKFIETYKQGAPDAIKNLPATDPYFKSEFLAETAAQILSQRGAADIALPKGLVDRVTENVGKAWGNLLGLDEKKVAAKGKFDRTEVAQINDAVGDMLQSLAGLKHRSKQGTPFTPEQIAQSQADAAARAAAAPPAADATPAGRTPSDLARDIHVAEGTTLAKGSKKGGEKAAAKREPELAAEWDQLLSDYTQYAAENGIELPTDPRALHQAAIAHSLGANEPRQQASSGTRIPPSTPSTPSEPQGDLADFTPQPPPGKRIRTLSLGDGQTREDLVDLPVSRNKGKTTTAQQPAAATQPPQGDLAAAGSTGSSPQTALETQVRPQEAPKTREQAIAEINAKLPPRVGTTEESMARIEAKLDAKNAKADPITDRMNQAEAEVTASPEFGGKRKEETRQTMIKEARTEALLDAVSEQVADDPDLLQRRENNGEVSYTGRFDRENPAHQRLAKELGLPASVVDRVDLLMNERGNTVHIDYDSAAKEVLSEAEGQAKTGDLSAAQRSKEYRDSSAADRIERKGDETKVTGESTRQKKAFVPLSARVNSDGTMTVTGFSPQRLLANAKKLIEFLAKERQPTGYKDVNDPQLVEDLNGYARNHANGYKGDGSGPVAGETPNPNYEPHAIPQDRFHLLNAAFADERSTSTSPKESAQLKRAEAERMARANDRFLNPATGEVNPLRDYINRSGRFEYRNANDVQRRGTKQILEPVIESLRPELMNDITFDQGPEDSIRGTGFKGDLSGLSKSGLPQAKKVGAGFMPSARSDESYMRAARSGDKESARAMVEEAAKAAGYDTTPLYHGFTKGRHESRVKDAPFPPTELGKSIEGDAVFVTPNKSLAELYSGRRWPSEKKGAFDDAVLRGKISGEDSVMNPEPPEGAGELQLFAKYSNPITFESISDRHKRGTPKSIFAEGYDAIIIPGVETILKSPSQVKSADPIVRDSSGKIIPLSQRFDSSKSDIRFMPSTKDEPLPKYRSLWIDRSGNIKGALRDQAHSDLLKSMAGKRESDLARGSVRGDTLHIDGRGFTPTQKRAIEDFAESHNLKTSFSDRSARMQGSAFMPEQAKKVTETPEFRQWFGKSKVVDENGQPKVFYHGTYGDFSTFKKRVGDIGIHFGTADAANDRIADKVPHRSNKDGTVSGQNVKPVFLKIENPIRLPDVGFWNADNLKGELLKRFPEDKERIGPEFSRRGLKSTKDIREFLQSKGYDGVVYRNTGEVAGAEPFRKRIEEARAKMEAHFGKGKNSFSVEDQQVPAYKEYAAAQKAYEDHRNASTEDSYIAFEPTQIKSATGNSGAFDPKNPDIRFMPGKKVTETPEFKQWFGKSKVVDEDGNPVIVYHGTRGDFSEFKQVRGGNQWGPGHYFTTDAKEAGNYATGENVSRVTVDKGEGAPNVKPVFLKSENPFRMNKEIVATEVLQKISQLADPSAPKDFADQYDSSFKPVATAVWSQLVQDHRPAKAVEILKAAGFDAITDGKYWSVFEPTQIKSATGNSGAFNPKNPDTRFMPGKKKTEPEGDLTSLRDKNFKKWAGDAEVVPLGRPLYTVRTGSPVVIEGVHGTTHDFTVADPSRTNYENDMGKGIYVSTTPEDVAKNYAGEGPDLTGRIERKMEDLDRDLMDADPAEIMERYDDLTQEEAELLSTEPKYRSPEREKRDALLRKLAKKEVAGKHDGATMKVHVKMENPFVIDEGEFIEGGTFDDNDEYTPGPIDKFIEALKEQGNYFYGDIDTSALEELMTEGANTSELIKAAKTAVQDLTSNDGELVGNEAVRSAIEAMGHDGIVDKTAGKKFGRNFFGGMDGMNRDTTHLIAFKPEQIKSATGNSTFDPKNPDMRFMPGKIEVKRFDENDESLSDPWDVAEKAEKAFKAAGLNIARNKELGLVAFGKDDEPVGATMFRVSQEPAEEILSRGALVRNIPSDIDSDGSVIVYDFDIGIDPKHQGGPVGYMLVKKAIEDARSEGADVMRNTVINPKMADMLEKFFGFEHEDEEGDRTHANDYYHTGMQLWLNGDNRTRKDLPKFMPKTGDLASASVRSRVEGKAYDQESETQKDPAGRLSGGSFRVDPATAGEDFHQAISQAAKAHKLGAAVQVKDPEFYRDPSTRLFFSEDKMGGIAVTEDRDLVSVFKHPDSKTNLFPILKEAAEHAKTLDAFDVNGFLPTLYAKIGFRPVARVPFNREYAPEGWPFELAGEPDVVLMVRDPEGKSGAPIGKYDEIRDQVPVFEDYDEALAAQQAARDKANVKVAFMPKEKGDLSSLVPDEDRKPKADKLGFTSALEQVVEGKLPNRASVEQVRATLDPAKSGIKKEELDWMGVDQFLEGKKTVDKAELMDFIKSNKVQIKEVVKGDYSDDTTHPEDEVDSLPDNDTKYSQYRLPGGENYREILLTIPASAYTFEQWNEAWGGDRTRAEYDEQVKRQGGQILNDNGGKNFKSPHWDERNVIAHIRQADLKDADGSKVRVIEEIQSDWHQKGRKEGYKSDNLKAAKDEEYAANEAYKSLLKLLDTTPEDSPMGSKLQQKLDAARERLEAAEAAVQQAENGVPDAPFKKTWHELAFKRALRRAVDDGMDKLAWVTGEIAAERFDLSKQVDSVAYDEKKQKLVAYKGYDKVIEKDGVKPEQLPEFIGKDVAQRLMEQEPVKDTQGETRWLEGEQLKVGGAGMKGFYDKILPDFVRKYVKKWGGKVETTKLNPKSATTANSFANWAVENNRFADKDEAMDAWRKLGNKDPNVRDWMDSQAANLHSVTITPQMRESVKAGQPMFMPGKAGKTGDLQSLVRNEASPEEAVKPLWERRRRSEDGKFMPGKPMGEIEAKDEALRISTRNPWAKKIDEDVNAGLTVGLEPMLADKSFIDKVGKTIRSYPYLRPLMHRNPRKSIETLTQHVHDNLLWLHDAMPEDIRATAKLWYDGARKITEEWSEKYALPRQSIAGAMAALSPQKDWFRNVSLAQRVIETFKDQQDHKLDKAMEQVAMARAKTVPELPKLMEKIRGKAFKDLTTAEKAVFVRLFDEAHNPREYPIISPDGTFMEPKKTGKGENQSAAWGSFGEIAKAVGVLEDPSIQNISDRMGDQHKVRNFFNNILLPNNPHGDVTIDTHAVAAGLLVPLAGADLEVSHNLSGPPSHAQSGSVGIYGIYADAYRQAAKERGILPREMQSITWEAVRGLFQAKWKTANNKKAVKAIWAEYAKGNLKSDEAREQIQRLAGGIDLPDWATGAGSGDRTPEKGGQPGNPGELPAPRVPRRRAGSPERGGGDGAAGKPPKAPQGGELAGFRKGAVAKSGRSRVSGDLATLAK